MKRIMISLATLFVGATMMFSCQQAEESLANDGANKERSTRAYGDKTPKMVAYVEMVINNLFKQTLN